METVNKNKSIALLVDYDNFNQDHYFKILFDELDEMGEIIIGRVYFSNEAGKNLSEKFRELDLDPIYQLRFSSGKNAVDIRMSIEAIELLNKDYIDAFCLATHDSDFTPLVKKLKEHNKYIIGAGRDDVSKHFKSSCDHFINVEQIHNASKPQEIKTETNQVEIEEIQKIIDERLLNLIRLVNEIINQNKETDGYIYLSRVTELLYLKNKEFNPKNYGASNNKVLSFFQKHLSDYYELKEEKNGWKIAVKASNTIKANPTIDKTADLKNRVKTVIEKYLGANKNGNVQKIQQTIKKQINGFTLKQVNHTKFVNFLSELGYKVIANNFERKS